MAYGHIGQLDPGEFFDDINHLREELRLVSEQMKFNGITLASESGVTLNFRVGSGVNANDTFSVTNQIIDSDTDVNLDTVQSNSNIEYLINQTTKRISNTRSAVSRLSHKEDMVSSQIATNEAVRSNYEDADFAKEQMEPYESTDIAADRYRCFSAS